MKKNQRAIVDAIALLGVAGAFLAFYIPTHPGEQMGFDRIIPLGLAALYWACREPLFRWLDRR